MSRVDEYIKRYGKRYCYEWFARTLVDRVQTRVNTVSGEIKKLEKRVTKLIIASFATQIVGTIITVIISRKLYKCR